MKSTKSWLIALATLGILVAVVFCWQVPTKAQSCVAPPANLISWWPGDGNAMDIQGTNHGTPQNGAAFADGLVDQTFSFDGTDDFVSIPFDASYDFSPTGQFTIDVWVKPGRVGGLLGFQALIVKSPPSSEWDWGLYLNPDNTFMAGRHLLHVVNSITVALPGMWYHAAVTYNNGNWNLYVNGQLEASASGVHITQSTGGLAFARKGESAPFADHYQGLLDEVEIFNRALTGAEIRSIFNAGSAGKCKAGDDDDDFDDDDERDDGDTDDDNDGVNDDADRDDDNDGLDDHADSDDDNDGIEDVFDSESHREIQDAIVGELAAGQEQQYEIACDDRSVVLSATAEAAEVVDVISQPLTVEIRDPEGTLVGISTPMPGRAVATAVPVLPGTYKIKIRNDTHSAIVYRGLRILRRHWLP